MKYTFSSMWFNGRKTYRVLQNTGGPCPLIGIINLLLLRDEIIVNRKYKNLHEVKFNQLIKFLHNLLNEKIEKMLTKSHSDLEMANLLKNVEDCKKLLNKIEDGLDLNIRFSDVNKFEFTSEIAMFDAYNIRLLHGWVIDPSNKELYRIIGNKTYNEVCDYLMDDSYLNDDEINQEENIISHEKDSVRNFISKTPQQVTFYGLQRTYEILNENQLALFFHNNHFSVVIKKNGGLFTLVTDEGIVSANSNITWQTLSQLHGDEEFVNNKFQQLASKDSKDLQRTQNFNFYKNNNNTNNNKNFNDQKHEKEQKLEEQKQNQIDKEDIKDDVDVVDRTSENKEVDKTLTEDDMLAMQFNMSTKEYLELKKQQQVEESQRQQKIKEQLRIEEQIRKDRIRKEQLKHDRNYADQQRALAFYKRYDKSDVKKNKKDKCIVM